MGLNTSGMDMDERTASPRSPLSRTAGTRWFMSLATQRNGTISRSKSPREAAVAGAKSSAKAMSIWVDEIRLVGTRNLPLGLLMSNRKLTMEGLRLSCRW